MAHFLGDSFTREALPNIFLGGLWIVVIAVLLVLQSSLAPAGANPKLFGTKRQKLHFWLIVVLGPIYAFVIPFIGIGRSSKDA